MRSVTVTLVVNWVRSYKIGDRVKIEGEVTGTGVAVRGGNSLAVTLLGDVGAISLLSGGNSFTGAEVLISGSIGAASSSTVAASG